MSIKQDYIIKQVGEGSISEIDFDLYENLFGENWSDEENRDWPNEIVNQSNYGIPIEINRLLLILTRLQEKGANYVGIDYHCDHEGYEIEGLEVRVATKEESQDYENKQAKKSEKDKKKEELLKEIDKLDE